MKSFEFNLIVENISLKKLQEIKPASSSDRDLNMQTLDDKMSAYFNILVPASGNSETVEGEMLRAINRIIYRWWNDGDYFYQGYGTETAGPAMAFLTNCKEIPIELRRTIIDLEKEAVGMTENSYEDQLYSIANEIVKYLDSKNGEYTPSNVDMWDYESEYEDVEEEDDEDDYYDEEEDDYEEDLDETITEALTKKQEEYKEDYVQTLKGNKKNFVKLYGDEAESVMYGTAVKMAKEKSKKKGKEKLKELVVQALSTPPKSLEEIQPISTTSTEIPFLTAKEVIELIGKKGEASVGDEFIYGDIKMQVGIRGDGSLVAHSIDPKDKTIIPIKFLEKSTTVKETELKERIKSLLKNPNLADRNKDGELSAWEEKVGAAIEKSIANKQPKTEIKSISAIEPEEEDDCDDIQGWGSSDIYAMTQSIHRHLGEPEPDDMPSINAILDAAREAVYFYWDDLVDCGEDEDDLTRDAFQDYMRRFYPDTFRGMQNFMATIDDDIMENYMKEDMDLGHEDNEPHMLKADLYRIGKYAMELYQMVDEFEGQGEVDFPHWWQAKIITAKDYLIGAKHYLDFETKEPEIDAAVDVIDMSGTLDNMGVEDEIEEGLPPGFFKEKYGIGKKKLTKEEIVNETFKSFVQKMSPKLGKSYATNLAGAIAAAKMKGAGKGPTAKQKARTK